MADLSEKVDESHAHIASPTSKLDSLSKEDLLKFVKRQMVNLQKLKVKNEDLSKKLTQNGAAVSDDQEDNVAQLEKRVVEIQDEKNEILLNYHAMQAESIKYKNLYQELLEQNTTISHEKDKLEKRVHDWLKSDKEIQEQLECMKMKDETMSTTLKMLQADIDKLNKVTKELTEENKQLKDEVLVLVDARDQLIDKIQVSKLSQSESLQKNEALFMLNEKNQALQEKVIAMENEKKLILTGKLEYEDHMKEMKSKLAQMDLDVNSYKSKLESVMTELQEQTATKGILELEKVELSKLFENIKTELDKKENDFTKVHMELSEENKILNDQISELKCELAEVAHRDKKQSENELEKLTAELVNVQDKVGKNEEEMTLLKSSLQSEITKNVVLQSVLQEAQIQVKELGNKEKSLTEEVTALKEKISIFQSSDYDIEFKIKERKLQSVIENLQNVIQRKEEEMLQSSETKENLVYEINELKEEKEQWTVEKQHLEERINEWDNMVGILKQEKDHVIHELDESEKKEQNLRKEIDFLMTSLNEALKERDSLQDEAFKLNEKNGASSDELIQMKEKVQELTDAKSQLETELNKVYSDKGSATAEIQFLKTSLHKVYADLDSVEREKESISVILQLAHEKEDTLIEENSALKSAIDTVNELKQNIFSLENDKADLFLTIKQLEFDNEVKCKLVIEKEMYVKELEVKILDMSESLAKSKRMYETIKGQIESEEASMTLVHENEIFEMKQAVESLSTEKEALRKNYESLMNTLNEKEDVMKAERSEIQSLNASLCDVRQEIDNSLHEIKQLNTMNEKLQKENEAFFKEISEVKGILEDVVKEKEDIQLQLEECKKVLVSNSEMMEHLRKVNISLQNVNDAIKANLEESEKSSSLLKTECKEIEQNLKALEVSYQNLKTEKEHIDEHIKELIDQKLAVELSNQSLRQKIDMLSEKQLNNVEEIKSENVELLSSMQSSSSQILQIQDKLVVSQEKKELLEKEIAELTKEIQILKQNNDLLQFNHEAVVSECFKLKQTLECIESKNRDEICTLEKSLDNFKSVVLSKDGEIVEFRQRCEVFKNQLEGIAKLLEDVSGEKIDVINDSQSLIKNLGTIIEKQWQLEVLKNRNSDIEHQLLLLDTESKSLKNELENRSMQCRNLEIELEELMKTKISLENEIMFSKEQSEAQQNETLMSQNEMHNLLHKNEMLNQMKAEIEDKLKMLEIEVFNKNTEACHLNVLKADLETQLLSQLSEIEQLNQEKYHLDVKLNSMNDIVKENSILQETIQTLQTDSANKIQELEKSLKDLENILKAREVELHDRCKDLESKMKELENEKNDKQQEQLQKAEIGLSKVEQIKAELKIKEDTCNKLKTVAVKNKRDLADLKSKFSNQTEELKKVQSMNITLQQQLDAISKDIDTERETNIKNFKEKLDSANKQLEDITKERDEFKSDFEKTLGQLTDLKTTVSELMSQKDELSSVKDALNMQIKTQEAKLKDLRKIEQECDANKIQKEELLKDKLQLQKKVKALEDDKKSEEEKYKKIIDGLHEQVQHMQKMVQNAKQEASQSSMMDLEIADYERTVNALNAQITEKEKEVFEHKAEVIRLEERTKVLQQEIDAVEDQRKHADDRGNKLKQLLVKAKKDLAEAKQLETEQKSSEAQLKGQVERLNQQVEELKVQVANISAEKQKVEDRMRNTNEGNQKMIKTLENHLATVQGDLDLARSELASCQVEYEGYKVRVHTVLKQQKTRGPNEILNETEKFERERLERVVEQLKSKLEEMNEKLENLKRENELLQDEHDHLLQRHNKSLQDLQEREDAYRKRIEDLTKEKTIAVSEQLKAIKQLSSEKEILAQSYKEQLQTIQDDHLHATELLHSQVDSLDCKNLQLQRELQQQVQRSTTSPRVAEKDKSMTPTPVEFVHDFRHIERQEGEGSEIIDQESSTAGSLRKPVPVLIPLDQLLTSDMDHSASISYSHPDVDSLLERLAKEQKRNEHLTEIMNENEAHSMRLTEQAKILKDEIRRLERNVEREKETQNLEYLKNILLKFLSLKNGDERNQLIPVLTTMLKLSPDEKSKLQQVAQGEEAAEANTPGWGSYLHRWSGLT